MHNSHVNGSSAALRVFIMFLCMWEVVYHMSRLLLKKCLAQYPNLIIGTRLDNAKNTGNSSNGGAAACRPLDDAKRTLLHRGPSYLVSFLHSIYATRTGIMHLAHLWNASNLDKLAIPSIELGHSSYRLAHFEVATTNTLFLSYLVYDLFHILRQFPKLGGVDTILHHILFALCSVINGTYGVMAFPFGWLYLGEASTAFLNIRWFLLKSGRIGPALDKVNSLFAASFFITRIGVYSVGIIHLFYFSLEELKSLPVKSGVPIPLLGMTCGCILLGWVLNIVWGYKILAMVVGGGKKNVQKTQ